MSGAHFVIDPDVVGVSKPPRPIAVGVEVQTAAEATVELQMDGEENRKDTLLQFVAEITPRSERAREYLKVMGLLAKGGRGAFRLEPGEDGRLRLTLYTRCTWER